jgi:hypothetical protein
MKLCRECGATGDNNYPEDSKRKPGCLNRLEKESLRYECVG